MWPNHPARLRPNHPARYTEQSEFKDHLDNRYTHIKRFRPESRLGSLTIDTPEKKVPLQVADLVVFFMTKWQRKMVFKQGRDLPRTAVQLLQRKDWLQMEHFSPEALWELAERGAEEIEILDG